MDAESSFNLSLLSRDWIIPILFTFVLYVSIQFAMICGHIFIIDPFCKAPMLSLWTWYINYFETSSFGIVVIIQLSRFAITSSSSNDVGSIFSTCFISVLAGTSSLINILGDLVGNCEDVFGVRLPGVLWAEWVTCVPFLYYIVLATDTKIKLSANDILIILLIATVFLAAAGMQISKSFSFSIFLLVIANAAFVMGSFLFYSVIFSNHRNHIMIGNGMTANERSKAQLQETKARLAMLLLIISPLFPIVYLLSFFRIIDHDTTYLLITICNVITKLIFTTLIANTHIHITAEIKSTFNSATAIQSAAETAAQEARQLFLRYIMHEVRVPLNSLTMGLGYLEQCPNLDDEAQEALLIMGGATGCMKTTLDDILTIGQPEDKMSDIQLSSFSVTKLANQIQASLHHTLANQQTTLSINIHPSVPLVVIGDKLHVQGILTSLIMNVSQSSNKLSAITMNITSCTTTTASAPNPETPPSTLPIMSTSVSLPFNREAVFSSPSASAPPSLFPSPLLPRLRRHPSAVSSSFDDANQLHRPNNHPSPVPAPHPPCNRTDNRRVVYSSKNIAKKVTVTFTIMNTGCGTSVAAMPALCSPNSQSLIHLHETRRGSSGNDDNIKTNNSNNRKGYYGRSSEDMTVRICKQWVSQLGGTLSCPTTSQQGGGITVTLPFDVKSEALEEKEVDTERRVLPVVRAVSTQGCNDTTINDNNDNSSSSNSSSSSSGSSSIAASSPQPTAAALWISTATATAAANLDLSGLGAKSGESSSTSEGRIASGAKPQCRGRDTTSNHTVTSQIQPRPPKRARDVTAAAAADGIMQLVSYSGDDRENTDLASTTTSSDHQLSPLQHNEDKVSVLSSGCYLKHILIVDDLLPYRRILAKYLKSHNIQSTMATNGLEGVSTVMEGRQTFELIFMDNSMPVMTGVEATKRLRAFGYSNLIVGLTGNTTVEDFTEFIAAGADAVILKPVTVLQINQILEYCQKYGNAHSLSRRIEFLDNRFYTVELK